VLVAVPTRVTRVDPHEGDGVRKPHAARFTCLINRFVPSVRALVSQQCHYLSASTPTLSSA
jgi:hypothetical protein